MTAVFGKRKVTLRLVLIGAIGIKPLSCAGIGTQKGLQSKECESNLVGKQSDHCLMHNIRAQIDPSARAGHSGNASATF